MALNLAARLFMSLPLLFGVALFWALLAWLYEHPPANMPILTPLARQLHRTVALVEGVSFTAKMKILLGFAQVAFVMPRLFHGARLPPPSPPCPRI